MKDWLPPTPVKLKTPLQLAIALYESDKRISAYSVAQFFKISCNRLYNAIKHKHAKEAGRCSLCLRKLPKIPYKPLWLKRPPEINPEILRVVKDWGRWKAQQARQRKQARQAKQIKLAKAPTPRLF